MAPKKKAAAKSAPAISKEAKERAEVASELAAEEQKKAAGQTEAQQEMREYHEGDFQKFDPITGEKRDLDEAFQPARIDRGETVEDVVKGRK
jgi:soluble cytochrome b562